MPSGMLSKRRRPTSLLALTALTLVVGCATTDGEVRRLRAQAAYEAALGDLCLNRPSTEACQPRVPAALASLNEAVRLNPTEARYFSALGYVHLQLRDLPEAIDAFKKTLEINPEDGDAHHYLGVALAESGRLREAVQSYQKALASPTYAHPETVYNNIGWAYYRLGQLREAEDALRHALRLEPSLEAAHYHLGLVLLKSGRREEAGLAFRRTLELAPESDFGRAAQEHLKALGDQR